MILIMDMVDRIVCAFGNLFDRPIKPMTVRIHEDVMAQMLGTTLTIHIDYMDKVMADIAREDQLNQI